MYGRSSEGHEQCCRKSDAGPVCLLTFLVMNKPKIGTRVHIPQFDPFPISRFFFLTWAQARQRRPHMGAQFWPRYRSLQLFFFEKKSRP